MSEAVLHATNSDFVIPEGIFIQQPDKGLSIKDPFGDDKVWASYSLT